MARGGGRVRIYLDVETRRLEAGLKRADRAMLGLERSSNRASGTLSRFNRANFSLSGSLKEAGKAAAGAAAAYVGISQVKAAIDATTDLAKATLTLNKNLGLSVKTASEFSAVAKSRDVDTRSLTMATKTLSTQMEAAKAGTESSVKAFQALGITQRELARTKPDQLLFKIADGAHKLGDGSARTAVLGKLLGRSFAGLGPVLRDGSAAMKEQLKTADEMGASFGGKNLNQVKEMIKEQRRAKLATLGLQVAFGTELAPALTKAIHGFANVINAIRKVPKPIRDLTNPIGKAIDAFGKLREKAVGIWPGIKNAFQNGVTAVTGFVNDIIGVVNHIPGVDIGLIGGSKPGSKSGGGDKFSGGKKGKGGGGGSGGGYARGGRVDRPMFMVGEEAPQHPEYVVATNPAYRARNVDLWRKAGHDLGIPGFALGGITNAIGKGFNAVKGGLPSIGDLVGKLPSPNALPGWLNGLGSYAIDRAKSFITDRLKSLTSSSIGNLPGAGGGIPGLTAIGHWLQSQGFLVSENPAFGGVSAGHASGSYHYQGRAIDVNWPNAAAEPAHLRPLYNKLAKTHPTELFFQNRGIPGPVPDHYDHLHLAYRRGGIVGFRKGGMISPRHGSSWINAGGSFTPSEAATLAWQAGASPREAKLLSTKIIGESGGNPRAVGHDAGGTQGLGLWQITTSYNDDLIRRYGGRSAMLDPSGIPNARAAIDILRRQGIGAWYAPSNAPGQLLRGRIGGGGGKIIGGGFTGMPGAVTTGVSSSSPSPVGAGLIAAGSFAKKGKKTVQAGFTKPAKTGGGGSDTTDQDLIDALEALNALLAEQLANQKALANVSQSQYGVLAKAIADVASGQIGGRVGLGFQSPSFASGFARY